MPTASPQPAGPGAGYGEQVRWEPAKPRLRPLRLLVAWALSGASIAAAAWLLPGLELAHTRAAFSLALALAVLNALLPPVLAALRLPYMLAAGFLLVLVGDALLLMLAAKVLGDHVRVDSFAVALLASLVISAVSLVLQVVVGANDDDEYSLRVIRRMRR